MCNSCKVCVSACFLKNEISSSLLVIKFTCLVFVGSKKNLCIANMCFSPFSYCNILWKWEVIFFHVHKLKLFISIIWHYNGPIFLFISSVSVFFFCVEIWPCIIHIQELLKIDNEFIVHHYGLDAAIWWYLKSAFVLQDCSALIGRVFHFHRFVNLWFTTERIEVTL